MFEFAKNPTTRVLAFGTAGALALSACSAGSSVTERPLVTSVAPNPIPSPGHPETTCKPDAPTRWERTPVNINSPRIAAQLGVSLVSVAVNGRYGSATCEQPVSEDAISSNTPPVVSVSGEGTPCLVIGTQEQPVAGAETAKVLAVCASEAPTA